MPESTSPILILDSNVWVSERMLHSALGTAALHALIKNGGQIGLPEIVELEATQVLLLHAAKAVDGLQKNADLLRQLSEQHISLVIPSEDLICKALDDRWENLSGVLHRQPFTLDHARAALMRILQKLPPSGPNNEQFRDCCVWQFALDMAVGRPVHFVSNDSAFYENRNRSHGLAKHLLAELETEGKEIHVHPHLSDFLSSMTGATLSVDEETLGEAIESAIAPRARALAAENAKGFEFGALRKVSITGYATPKPALIAVFFSAVFNLSRFDKADGSEKQETGKVRVVGSCSFDPKASMIFDVEVSEWSVSLDGAERGYRGTFQGGISSITSEENYRIL